MMLQPGKPYRDGGIEHQPYRNSETGVILCTETPTDLDYLRRRMIAADHSRPDQPVFDPEDYS